MDSNHDRSYYIEKAIIQTLAVHPENANHLVNVLYNNCFQVYPLNFTSTNGARKSINSFDSRDFIKYVLEKIVSLYGSMLYDWYYIFSWKKLSKADKENEFFKCNPFYSACCNAADVIRTQSDPITYYQININELFELVSIVVDSRFNSSWYQMGMADPREFGSIRRREIDQKSSFIDDAKALNEKLSQVATLARDVQFYGRTINNCFFDVLSGRQLLNKRNEYALDGTLFASQDIGNKRYNQEDSVIILEHPKNPKFKLLAVADGMGGQDVGEIASSMTIKSISDWFVNLPPEMYHAKEWLEKEFRDKVKAISLSIAKYNKDNNVSSGCTFTGAIVADTRTIIAHVGDSRAYTIKSGVIKQHTIDQSRVWPTYRRNDGVYVPYSPADLPLPVIDDLRFQHYSNEIYNYMGANLSGKEDEFTKVRTLSIDNKEYDKLLIMSDGVSDLLSSQEIAMISKTTPPARLTATLVDTALSRDARRIYPSDAEHEQEIKAGKDNASVVAYIR